MTDLPDADRPLPKSTEVDDSQGSGECISREFAEAWASEIDRRIADFERGEIQADDSDVVMRRLRVRLAERRAESI
jgi:hypothetical protein